jgi:hypothetical protein
MIKLRELLKLMAIIEYNRIVQLLIERKLPIYFYRN